MQTRDIVFSAIIPILDTSKLVIEFKKKPNKTKHQTISDCFSPSEKNKTCQGLSRSISSLDFDNYAWWDFILGRESLLWGHKQALSSQPKLGIFPACTCLYVAGISKWSDLLGWLTGTTRLSCCCQPWTELSSCLSQAARSSKAPDLKGMVRARVTLLTHPKELLRAGRYVSIACQSCCFSESLSALCVCEEKGEKKWEDVGRKKKN